MNYILELERCKNVNFPDCYILKCDGIITGLCFTRYLVVESNKWLEFLWFWCTVNVNEPQTVFLKGKMCRENVTGNTFLNGALVSLKVVHNIWRLWRQGMTWILADSVWMMLSCSVNYPVQWVLKFQMLQSRMTVSFVKPLNYNLQFLMGLEYTKWPSLFKTYVPFIRRYKSIT